MLRRIASMAKRQIERIQKNSLIEEVNKITASQNAPETTEAEHNFSELQSRFEPRNEYGYDPLSTYRRATSRVASLLQIPGLSQPGLLGLEIGAGDGMLSVLLQAYGHSMTMSDLKDWRVQTARTVRFVEADCCNEIPFEENTFDFALSYNSFEHFPDPAFAFSEMVRVLKPGGYIHLQFNPLYCSPWGLHAYRMLRMPYPQFLFAESFLDKTLKDTGIWDLGEKRTELQNLNGWKPSQFDALWRRDDVEVCSCVWNRDEKHLNLVREYPKCFSGRGLTIEDLVCAGLTITMRKS